MTINEITIVIRKISLLSEIEKNSQGQVKICLTGDDLENSFKHNTLSIIMHIEGAECIDENFYNFEVKNTWNIVLAYHILNQNNIKHLKSWFKHFPVQIVLFSCFIYHGQCP